MAAPHHPFDAQAVTRADVHTNRRIPILGQNKATPDRIERKYGEVHDRSGLAQGDILDSEIAEIGELLDFFSKRAGQRRDYDAFTREIEDRFHKIGFAVDVSWATFALDGQRIEGALSPMIEVCGRVDRADFDHDQKVHEITNNILDIKDADGIIKADMDTVRATEEAHKGHPH